MPKRILIIDDDRDMLDMLSIVFQDAEYEVVLSDTGMEYEEIKALHPDLVLMDVNIIGYKVSGDAICAALKSHADTAKLPVFLLSGEQNLVGIASKCQADGYFSKPFDMKSLRSTVRNTLL